MTDSTGLLGIVVAALGGLAIGVEREKSGHATGRHARLGGVRTFTLLGGLAGLGAWLATYGQTTLGSVLVAGAVALVIVGYAAASRHDVDATTEVAALVVVGAGVAAGLGSLALASGIVAITTLLLIEKSRLHTIVAKINDEELRAAVRFGVMAVVILPLLPEGPIGPFGGIRPRALWMLVLFFTGLSFAGYLARRLFGAGRGYPVAGLLGGLVSSTNVTFSFARMSRREGALSQPLAIGTVAACTVLFLRVIVAASVLNADVARMLVPYLAAPFAIGLLVLALWWKRKEPPIEQQAEGPTNPLHIVPALEMTALFQIVLFAVRAVSLSFGDRGLLLSGAVLGLTDVDALTISMTTGVAAGSAQIAAQAIAIGILANCLLKGALALALGTPRFRMLTAGVLGAMAVALVVALRVVN